jgi:hypothetical protein
VVYKYDVILQSSLKKRTAAQKQKQKRLQSGKKKGENAPLFVLTMFSLEAAKTDDVAAEKDAKNKHQNQTEDTGTGMVRGLGDALTMNNQGAMEAEVARQDAEAVNNLEKELREENINVSYLIAF